MSLNNRIEIEDDNRSAMENDGRGAGTRWGSEVEVRQRIQGRKREEGVKNNYLKVVEARSEQAEKEEKERLMRQFLRDRERANRKAYVKMGMNQKLSPRVLNICENKGDKDYLVEEEYCRDQMREFLRHQRDIHRDGKITGYKNTTYVQSFSNHLKFKLPQINEKDEIVIDEDNDFKIKMDRLNHKSLRPFNRQVRDMRWTYRHKEELEMSDDDFGKI